jgi:hypothetical protein
MDKRGYSRLNKYKETVLPFLKKAQKGRNLIIHSDWMMVDGTVKRSSVSARGSFKFSSEIATLKEILAVNQSIEEARRELFALVNPAWTRARRRVMRGHKEGNT